MKSLFSVVSLAVLANLGSAQFTYPDPEPVPEVGAWVTLKSREYRKSLVKDILEDGVELVIDTNIENGALSNTDFDLDSITSVEKQTVENGTNYRFSVIIDDKEVKGRVNYTVFHPEDSDDSDEVVSSALIFYDRSKQGEAGAPAGQNAWSRVSLSKFHESEVIQNALNDGIDEIINQGIAHGLLPNATFEVSEPNYIASVKVSGGNKYRFQVGLRNTEYGSGAATFVVLDKKSKDTNEVVSYFLDHHDIVIPEPQAPEAPEVPEEDIEEEEAALEEEAVLEEEAIEEATETEAIAGEDTEHVFEDGVEEDGEVTHV